MIVPSSSPILCTCCITQRRIHSVDFRAGPKVNLGDGESEDECNDSGGERVPYYLLLIQNTVFDSEGAYLSENCGLALRPRGLRYNLHHY